MRKWPARTATPSAHINMSSASSCLALSMIVAPGGRLYQLNQAQREGLMTTAANRSRTHKTHGCHDVTMSRYTLLTACLETRIRSNIAYRRPWTPRRHPLHYQALPDWVPWVLWAHDIGPGALLTFYTKEVGSMPLYHIKTPSGSPNLSQYSTCA